MRETEKKDVLAVMSLIPVNCFEPLLVQGPNLHHYHLDYKLTVKLYRMLGYSDKQVED